MDWENCCNYKREVSFQGRLDKTLERQKIKLRDNLIKLTGTPEDVLVVKRKTTINGDLISKVITDQKIVNCIFPILKDVPIRKVTKEFEDGYTLTSLVSAYGDGSEKGQKESTKGITTFDIIVPFDSDIDIGDTLIRVFVQESVKASTVMVFEVLEILSDLSNNAPLTTKVRVAISNDPIDLSKPSYKLIMALSKRRVAANY
jgi:hypothetical protein